MLIMYFKMSLADILHHGLLDSLLPDHLPFWEEMLEMSKVLAEGLPFVRVDWYYANGQLYFGELTFYLGSGFDEFVPDEFNELAGSWITLPGTGN